MHESTETELGRIYRRDGVLVPAIVVDEARPETAPLHAHFTWDDSEAAEEWRREEARRLIRNFRIVVEDAKPSEPAQVSISIAEGPTVPAYMNITHPVTGLRGYYATEELLADERSRQVILDQLRRDIAALRRKYQHLEEFGAVMRAELEPMQQAAV